MGNLICAHCSSCANEAYTFLRKLVVKITRLNTTFLVLGVLQRLLQNGHAIAMEVNGYHFAIRGQWTKYYMANLGIQTARQPDKGHHLGVTAPRESDACVLQFSKVVFTLDDMNSLLQILQWIPSGLTRKRKLHRWLRKPCVCLSLCCYCWDSTRPEVGTWTLAKWMEILSDLGPCSLCRPLHFPQPFWPFTSSKNTSSLCSAQCYVAAWMGGEFGGECIHVYGWLSPFAVHLKPSQHC